MKDIKKNLGKIKLAVTIVIIAGVIIHLAFVYNAAKSIEITDKKIVGVYPKYPSVDEYEVKFMLTLNNPKHTNIEVEYISYKIYIENEYLGKGEKPRFYLEHGQNNQTFLFSFSIFNLTTPTSHLLMNGNANMTIKGDVIIPAKFLGLFTWRYIKVPYTIHERVKIS
ncbi:MAG: hypothetical protein FE043_01850 [Thermoplasmata archaeon]|nr:MAG: hypothetical protein FE043_01850 [Thermoplasmata archaeon]